MVCVSQTFTGEPAAPKAGDEPADSAATNKHSGSDTRHLRNIVVYLKKNPVFRLILTSAVHDLWSPAHPSKLHGSLRHRILQGRLQHGILRFPPRRLAQRR